MPVFQFCVGIAAQGQEDALNCCRDTGQLVLWKAGKLVVDVVLHLERAQCVVGVQSRDNDQDSVEAEMISVEKKSLECG